MSYIAVPLNHFRLVQAWAQTNHAEATLDMANFELQVKVRNRYYRFHPQFVANTSGRHANVGHLTQNTVGFIGWLPYRPTGWDKGADKLVFKKLLAGRALRAPAVFTGLPLRDFIYKWSRGSFGYELYGPYHAGHDAPRPPPSEAGPSAGELFAEEFIQGDILKAWFWGATPFFAHLQPYPMLEGDGTLTVEQLVTHKCLSVHRDMNDNREMDPLWASLAYQGLSRADVPARGTRFWLDYRYGRSFKSSKPTSQSDCSLASLAPGARDQITVAGQAIAEELRRDFPAPVLYSLDGVLAPDGNIWWLEMNSNPVLPPDGYPVMFDNLFGAQRQPTRTEAHAN